MKLDSKTKDILEWIICIIIAFILALIIRYYVGTPTIVKQTSMFPTLVQYLVSKYFLRVVLNHLLRVVFDINPYRVNNVLD